LIDIEEREKERKGDERRLRGEGRWRRVEGEIEGRDERWEEGR
jgi:hypothetical protein